MKSQEFLGQGKAVSNVMVKRVERLTRQLTLLHESEIYSTLPTLALVHPTIWLTETFKSRGNWVKMLKYALLNLRSFGWLGREGGDVLALCERGEGVDGANGTDKNGINGDKNGTDKNGIEEDGKLNITSDRAMVNIEFVRSLKHAAEALTALGREKDAENCTKLSEACLGMMTVI